MLVGYGRVGKRIAGALEASAIHYGVAEQNRELVEDMRNKGIIAVSGDAADPAVLIQAHIVGAAMLVVATPDPLNVRQMADIARTLNPEIEIVLRTHIEEESMMLRKDGIGTVFFGEDELAKCMSGHVLKRFAPEANVQHRLLPMPEPCQPSCRGDRFAHQQRVTRQPVEQLGGRTAQ